MSIYTTPENPCFVPISLEMKDRVEAIRLKSENAVYIYSFVSMYLWNRQMQLEICLCQDAFLASCRYRGDNAYMFPCGSDDTRLALLGWLFEQKAELYYVSDEDLAFLQKHFACRFTATEYRDDFSYIYDRAEQIAMCGRRFKNLRYEVRAGRALHNWRVEEISDANIERVEQVLRRWAKSNQEQGAVDFRESLLAIRNYKALGMWGLLYADAQTDYAFILGSYTNKTIFDINICKTTEKNIDTYIKWELYQRLPKTVAYIDSEDDLGLEGLRFHKTARVPCNLVRIWKVALWDAKNTQTPITSPAICI